MAWLLDCLDDDVDGTEDKKELEGTILQTLLDELEEGSDFRNALSVRPKSNRNI
jgi:hypothetical protein